MTELVDAVRQDGGDELAPFTVRVDRSHTRTIKPRRLLAKVEPIAGESLISVVSAAAAANRLATVRPILGLVGAPHLHEALHVDRTLLEALSRLTGIDPDELTGRMYGEVTGTATRTFFGQEVPGCWLTTAKRVAPGTAAGKAVPPGAKERRLHYALWDVALFDVCPESGAELLDHCPRCRHRLTWTLSNVGVCSACGLDIAAIVPAGLPSPEELRGVRFVADLLAPWRDAATEARLALPPVLQKLPTVELVQLTLMIPELSVEVQSAGSRRYRKWSRRTHGQLAGAVDVLRDWPLALGTTLDALIDGTTGAGRCGIKGKLGGRFSSMVHHLRQMADDGGIGSASSTLLLETMAAHFSSRPDFLLRKDCSLGEFMQPSDNAGAASDGPFLRLSEAKKLVGWSNYLTRRLAELRPEIVAYSDGKGTGAPFVMRRKELLELKVAWDDAMSINQVSARLGMSDASCLGIIDAGLLPMFDPRLVELKAAGRATQFVSRTGLEALLQQLQEDALEAPAYPIPLLNAVLMFRSVGLGWGQMLQAIIDKRIPHYRGGRELTGLPFLVDRTEVTAFLDASHGDMPLSTLSLARLLGVSQSTVTALAKIRVLAALPGRGKKQAWQFPANSVTVFRAQFATTKQVAVFLQLPNRLIRNILPAALRQQGAKPIVGADSQTINANLVWRLSEVELLRRGLLSELDRYRDETNQFRGSDPRRDTR